MHKPLCRLLASALTCSIVLLSLSIPVGAVPDPLRSIDGSNNNATNTDWGMAGVQLRRLSTASYGDDIETPGGSGAISARTVSNAVAAQVGSIENNRNLSDFVWTWGQFLDHDIDLTHGHTPEEHFPIPVPSGDSHFDPMNTGTQEIGLSRSHYDTTTGTDVSNPRQQINSITAYIDASNVYGSDATRAAVLRTFVDGKLKTSTNNFLPFNTDGLDNAMGPRPDFFLAGDVRANEQPSLIAMHTLFVREHNRLTEEMKIANPTWTDEDLYQEARRIVIAQMQAITVNEFLPALFGTDVLGPYSGYDHTVDAGIANIFSTAAYRLGHSMISPTLLRTDENGDAIADGHLPLLNGFFRPDRIINEGGIDPVIRGIAEQRMQEIDTKEIDAVRNFLFGPPGAGGFDLAALNIQRGRDHGLAGYNQAREDYGLSRKTSFSEVTSDTTIAAALESVYNGNIDAVDVWIGGLAEDHIAGSSVGELFTTILTDQFQRLRDGDRFWYEHYLNPSEISDINATRLSDIILRNTDIQAIQENVFFAVDRIPPTTDLSIYVDGPVLTLSGSAITLDVAIENTGTLNASGVVLTLDMPIGMTFLDASDPDCSQVGLQLECAVDPVDIGSTLNVTVDLLAQLETCQQDYSILASVTSDETDGDSSNNQQTWISFFGCPQSTDINLSVELQMPQGVTQGDGFRATLSIANTGPTDANNVSATITLPSGLSLVPEVGSACTSGGGHTIVCTVPLLSTNETLQIELMIDVAENATCPDTAITDTTVSATENDFFDRNNATSTSIDIACIPEADMSLDLSGPSTVLEGETITIDAVVTNNGDATTAASVAIDLPTGITFLGGAGCNQNGAIIECTTTAIPAENSANISLQFKPLASLQCNFNVPFSGGVSVRIRDPENGNNRDSLSVHVECAPPQPESSDDSNDASRQEVSRGGNDENDGYESPGSYRGSGVIEGRMALTLLCRHYGLKDDATYVGHYKTLAGQRAVISGTSLIASQQDVVVNGHAFTDAEFGILCGMKKFMNRDDLNQRQNQKFRHWMIDELATVLNKEHHIIRQALLREDLCELGTTPDSRVAQDQTIKPHRGIKDWRTTWKEN